MSRTRRKTDKRWFGYGNTKGRDGKPQWKPPKVVKDCWKRCRKAKEKDAVRHEEWDTIPQFKHTDVWEWT